MSLSLYKHPTGGFHLQSVEAARECGMACVVVAGRNPLYELTAADLVVRQLEELSLVNLKQLFQLEDRVDPRVSFLHVFDTQLVWAVSTRTCLPKKGI